MNSTKSNSSMQLVSFYLAEHLYGLDIHIVKEVNPNTDIAPVPLSIPCIKGLVNIRGQIVLVIDMAVILGKQPAQITEDSQLIILKTTAEILSIKKSDISYEAASFGDKPVALLVDRIGDVLTASGSAIEKAPSHLSEHASALVEYVVRTDSRILTALNAEAILAGCSNKEETNR